MRKISLITLLLLSSIILSSPAYALMYYAPAFKPGLVFVDKSNLLYNNGDFSDFSWAISRNINPGPGNEPFFQRKEVLGPPDDLTTIGEPDNSYVLGRGGQASLGFGSLFGADGVLNTLPNGEHWRKINKILQGIDVVIFQDAIFAGGIIYGKEAGLPPIELVRFNDGILDGKGFSINDVAILLDLDQIDAADGKLFSRLIIEDRGGSCPYFELDAAGVKVIPEPASMLLFGIGLVGLAGGRIRKKLK